MIAASLLAATLIGSCAFARQQGDASPRPFAEQLSAATTRFQQALASHPEAREKLVSAYAEQLLALAASAPATQQGLEACVSVLMLEPGQPMAARAIEAIVHSGAEPKLLVALAQSLMRGAASFSHEALLDALVTTVDQREVQGYAAYALGHLRLDFADDVAYFTDARVAESARSAYAQKRGAALLAANVARGVPALREAGLASLRRVVDDFYFAEHRKAGYLGAVADAELFEFEHLQVGMVAPEIDGADEDGVPFKLSDYRGKVVALDFWGFWCPICRHNLSGERLMVDRLKDAPFALVGINSDPKTQLEVELKHDRLSWRSFFDGGDAYGPIATRWNVSTWPTMFVLDEAGVIQLKSEDLDEVERMVDTLLARSTSKPAAGGAGAPAVSAAGR